MSEKTFENFDHFELKPFAEKLTAAITTFSPFYEEAYVLSLNAEFGAGKTTFLKMWEHQLKNDGYQTVFINCWDSDFDEDPIVSIAFDLLKSLENNKTSNDLKRALEQAVTAFAIVTNVTIKACSNIDILKTMDVVEKTTENRYLVNQGKLIFDAYDYKQKTYKNLKEKLTQYCEKLENKPLIVFIDELDRVRPTYAIKYLEAIKHLFSVKGICFVIAVNKEQLEKSIKQIYGDIDFDRYFLRFITREATLPNATLNNLEFFIKNQIKKYIFNKLQEGVEFPFSRDKNQILIKITSLMANVFDMTPREIIYFFRSFSQFMAIQNNDIQLNDFWLRANIFLICLYIKRQDLYQKIKNDTLTFQDIGVFLQQNTIIKVKNNHKELYDDFCWDLMRFICTNREEDKNEAVKILWDYDACNRNNTNFDSEKRNILTHLPYIVNGYRYTFKSKSAIKELQEKFDEWDNFITET